MNIKVVAQHCLILDKQPVPFTGSDGKEHEYYTVTFKQGDTYNTNVTTSKDCYPLLKAGTTADLIIEIYEDRNNSRISKFRVLDIYGRKVEPAK